jgi:multidrug efflux pump subunit AcrA (membrane-fusion protein)
MIDNLYKENRRTEEVQNIIERMPAKFGYWTTIIVLLLFVNLGVFGWLIKYPDAISGTITINSNLSPLKLVSNTSGKLKLYGIKSKDAINEGTIIAYIENSAKLEDVLAVADILDNYNSNTDDPLLVYKKFPNDLSLGELNTKFYAFKHALQEIINYKTGQLPLKQISSLNYLLDQQTSAIGSAVKRLNNSLVTQNYAHKFYKRDSILYKQKVISESELDKSELTYISAKDAYQGAMNNLINIKQTAQQTETKLLELTIQDPEKQKELDIAMVSTYNDLVDNIKLWQQKYVFKSPYAGNVQFLKFFNDNQFIQAGEAVFTIIPKKNKVHGEVILPARGAGKIKEGQKVVVKLDNFPYMEFGTIQGKVSSISLTTNTTKVESSEIEAYLVLVDFPHMLKTNYGSTLDVKAETKGTAEIITNDRRLIQRLFGNLKYSVSK